MTTSPQPHRSAALFPTPGRAFAFLDRRTPVSIKQVLVEPLLNRLFREAIQDGDFEELAGRRVRLEVQDLDGEGITLGYWMGRLRLVEAQGEVTIRGDLAAFAELARGSTDPDTLFFRRRLAIEGDTELGLEVKNLLDAVEFSLPGRP